MALRTLVRDGAGPGPPPVSERGFAGLLLHPNHYYSINVTYPVVVTVVNLILASRSGIKNIIKKNIARAQSDGAAVEFVYHNCSDSLWSGCVSCV